VRAQINGQKDLLKEQTKNLRQQSENLDAQTDEIYQRIAFQEAEKRAANKAELEAKIEEIETARRRDQSIFERERETWAAEKQDLLEQWRKKEQGYAEAINGLTARIKDLEGRQIKVEKVAEKVATEVKKTTDEFKKQTGQLPGK
jgi:chromosome segregation ATPase